jgi:hypothetical protein
MSMARDRRRVRIRMHRTRVSVHHPRTRAFLSGDNLQCSVKASDVNVYVCRSELYGAVCSRSTTVSEAAGGGEDEIANRGSNGVPSAQTCLTRFDDSKQPNQLQYHVFLMS